MVIISVFSFVFKLILFMIRIGGEGYLNILIWMCLRNNILNKFLIRKVDPILH